MADQKQQFGDDNKKPFDKPKEGGQKHEKSAPKKESAHDMWQKINKSVSHDKRKDFRGNIVKNQSEKKRFEQKSSAPISPFAQAQKPSAPAPKEEVKAEVKQETKPEIKPATEPINPFAQAQTPPTEPSLPPSTYEAEQEDENEEDDWDDPQVTTERDEFEPKSTPFEDSKKKSDVMPEVGAVPETKKESEPEIVEVVDEQSDLVSGDAKPHVSPPAASLSAGKAEAQDFKTEFWDILEQAGFGKKKLLIILIVLLVGVFALLFYLFGWYKIFGFGGDAAQSPVTESVTVEAPEVKPETTPEEKSEEKPVEKSAVIVNYSGAWPIVSSYIFGLEYAPFAPINAVPIGAFGTTDGIASAVEIGLAIKSFQQDMLYYVDILRKINNMYKTDLYQLANTSVDRRAVINAHLTEMKALIDEAQTARTKIVQSVDNFNRSSASTIVQRKKSETQFFEFIAKLQGQQSFDALNFYIDFSRQTVELRAYFNAYRTLGSLFTTYLAALEPRYKDISANEEAIIKGIKVFDIPSSDIKAIIPFPTAQ